MSYEGRCILSTLYSSIASRCSSLLPPICSLFSLAILYGHLFVSGAFIAFSFPILVCVLSCSFVWTTDDNGILVESVHDSFVHCICNIDCSVNTYFQVYSYNGSVVTSSV